MKRKSSGKSAKATTSPTSPGSTGSPDRRSARSRPGPTPKRPRTRKRKAQQASTVSPRHAEFVAGVLAGLSDYDAAIAAGFAESTARNTKQKLRAHPWVRSQLETHAARLAESALVTAEQLHRDLSAMWSADIADVLDAAGAVKPVGQWPPIWRRMVRGLDVRELYERSHDGKQAGEKRSWDKIGELVKIRFAAIEKIGELLARHRGVKALAAERVEVDLRVEEVARRLQAGRKRARDARSAPR